MKESQRSNWEAYWEDKDDAREVYSNADRVLRNLQRIIDPRGKRVLEIGAGTGRDSFPLAEHGAEVWQLDYAENSLRILQRLAERQHLPVRIIGGDTFCLPFRDGTFDVVFHQGLLEHFRKPKADQLLRENIRVLKSGGLLLVDVPQRYHLYTVVKHILIAMNLWFAGWERSFSVVELRRVLRRLGVVPIAAYGDWMYPSFIYRAVREVLKKIGVVLPLQPRIPGIHGIRVALRAAMLATPLPLYSGISIGVIARKP
ncbi:MAG: class I SAM-dependent methyltransferase [Ignavibacteriales bacterium]|nr:class I SAM-dependent methyltransferase [Ignavibacteriales bacterium]